jgi:hypothetical protein
MKNRLPLRFGQLSPNRRGWRATVIVKTGTGLPTGTDMLALIEFTHSALHNWIAYFD